MDLISLLKLPFLARSCRIMGRAFVSPSVFHFVPGFQELSKIEALSEAGTKAVRLLLATSTDDAMTEFEDVVTTLGKFVSGAVSVRA